MIIILPKYIIKVTETAFWDWNLGLCKLNCLWWWVQSPHKTFYSRNQLVRTHCTISYMDILSYILTRLHSVNYRLTVVAGLQAVHLPVLVALFKQLLLWWSFARNTLNIYMIAFISVCNSDYIRKGGFDRSKCSWKSRQSTYSSCYIHMAVISK